MKEDFDFERVWKQSKLTTEWGIKRELQRLEEFSWKNFSSKIYVWEKNSKAYRQLEKFYNEF
jgi:hypothetical protein